MTALALLTTIGSLVLLALAFGPLERAFPARAGQRVLRPGLGVDLCFFAGQYLLWSGIALSLLLAVRDRLALAALDDLRAWVATRPFWAQIVAAVALGDLAVYWFHRACHTFEPLWRFHAVHHSAEHLDFLAAHREHPFDGIVTQLSVNLPAFVMGFPLHRIAAFLALRGMWAVFIHSNVRLPLGPLRWLFGAPELHHWHHAPPGADTAQLLEPRALGGRGLRDISLPRRAGDLPSRADGAVSQQLCGAARPSSAAPAATDRECERVGGPGIDIDAFRMASPPSCPRCERTREIRRRRSLARCRFIQP